MDGAEARPGKPVTPFAVSSLAWPGTAMDDALALLASLGCTAVEIAPHATFGRWTALADDASRLRDRFEHHGLECVALQGILHQAGDVALFGTSAQEQALETHLDHVAALAGTLGARACVFGAPRLRNPGHLGADDAWHHAIGAFRRSAPAFAAVNSTLAIEPNATHYGCRFLTTTAEAARFLADAATPGLALQLDTGTLFLEHEPPAVLHDAAPLAAHLHISEPDLAVVGEAGTDHRPIAAALRAAGYAGPISIEMQQVPDWPAAIRRAVAFVQNTYL